ncbi:MAG: ribonuclease P protein component [Myxococcota bacterium]
MASETSPERSPGDRDLRFRRSQRLLARRDFDRVLRTGSRRSSAELVVVTSVPGVRGRLQEPARPSGEPRSRLGLTVGRKAGNAVERNRFKRRVREWFRHQQAGLDAPIDLVVIARRPAIGLSFDELGRRLARMTRASVGQASGMNQENPKS